MRVEIGSGAAGLDTDDDEAGAWHALLPEVALARLLAGEAAVARSPDGFSQPGCLAAATGVARHRDDTILFAACGNGRSQWILPLRIERSFGIAQAVPLAAPLGQYCPEPPDTVTGDTLRRLTDWLRTKQGCDLLVLRRVRETNPLAPLLEQAGAVKSQPSEALCVDLAAFGDFESYQQSFSSKKRANWRRDLRRLEDEGKVSFEVVSGGDATDVLRTAIAWKRAWLDDFGVTSPVIHSEAWCDALIECASDGHGHVSILSVDDRAVAVELGFVEDDDYVAYMGAFEPSFGKLSVGQEQMRRTIEWCFSRGFARYDLLPPGDDYKRYWCRDSTGIAVADYALSLTMAGSAASFAHGRLRPLARNLMLSAPARVRKLLLGR
ncbi:MAG: GNAT family N-acetyltransferase [Mesorhizobium sp.]|nr:GNAT family N-acetyltransferase [Mesorhizobium sp.]